MLTASSETRFEDVFFFSARDNDLLSSDSPDPLGFEVIWISFAQTVLPNLNTQCIGARNFGVVTILHWLVDRWMREDFVTSIFETPDAMLKYRRECLLVAESLLVYSTLARYNPPAIDRDQLFGIRRAQLRWRNHQEQPVQISPAPEHLVLSGQYSAGHFGRYDAALRGLGVLNPEDDYDARVCKTWTIEVQKIYDNHQVILKPLEQALTNCFARLTPDNNIKAFDFGSFQNIDQLITLRSHELLRPLTEKFADVLNVLDDKPDAPPQHYLWKVLDTTVFAPQTAFETALSQAEIAENSAASNQLKHVLELEGILARVEAIFDSAWQTHDNSDSLSRVFDELQNLEPTIANLVQIAHDKKMSTTTFRRLAIIARLIKASANHNEFGQKLVAEYHASIMKERNRTQWLTVDGNRISPLTQAYAPGASFNQDGSLRMWRRRGYYLQTLESFYKDYRTAVDTERSP